MNLRNRLEKLRQRLAEKELDAILVSQAENRRYLSGFDGSDGYLLITPEDAILATDSRYLEQARNQTDYQLFPANGTMNSWLTELLTGLNLRGLGFETDISFSLYQRLSDILNRVSPQTQLIPIEGWIESLRSVKEAAEVKLITRAAAISDAAIEHIMDAIRPGMTEQAVAWEIEKFMREQGSEAIPFEVIVASGTNSALPHARPSLKPIGEGEPIIIDIGARVNGYCSDLSRTLYLGSPDETFRRVYDSVLGAQLTAIATVEEGMTGGEADSMARIVIDESGYGNAFSHALGHGVGLAVHELPRLGPNSKDKLTNNMVFTIEPGIYLPGWGGVRLEDLVIMEKGKIKLISKSKRMGV
ncbi:MAG: aminopeptidase P family protein [Dehalococcoidales bacterium]|nr:aminopeptidase P family protein [Dehalococcoidales bacterium]